MLVYVLGLYKETSMTFDLTGPSPISMATIYVALKIMTPGPARIEKRHNLKLNEVASQLHA